MGQEFNRANLKVCRKGWAVRLQVSVGWMHRKKCGIYTALYAGSVIRLTDLIQSIQLEKVDVGSIKNPEIPSQITPLWILQACLNYSPRGNYCISPIGTIPHIQQEAATREYLCRPGHL